MKFLENNIIWEDTMKSRMDLQQNVEKEIEGKLIDCRNEFSNCDASTIYQELKKTGFIKISAPQEETPMMHMLTMDSLKNYNQGSSIKPGNIRLNIKKLIDAVPDILELAIGVTTDIPILQVCAALNLWKTLRNVSTVQITKDQAFVIVALWENCNAEHKIELDKGYDAVNILLTKYGEEKITEIKYNKIIDSLIRIDCIELEENVIWLREWISKQYISSI